MKQLTFVLILIGSMTMMFATCSPSGKAKKGKTCQTNGIVKDMTGELDGCEFLITLEDGTNLLPVDYTVDITGLKDKQKITFTYEQVEAMNVCMAGETVKVTCLTILD